MPQRVFAAFAPAPQGKSYGYIISLFVHIIFVSLNTDLCAVCIPNASVISVGLSSFLFIVMIYL